MRKLFVPLALKHKSPIHYTMACRARNQREADRIIAMGAPQFISKEEARRFKGGRDRVRGIKGEAQAAGEYSLDLCQGGFGSLVKERQLAKHVKASGKILPVAQPSK